MPPRPKSAIPVGTQFSPDLVDLPAFLQAICAHSGKRLDMQEAIWRPPVHLKKNGVPASHRTANLPLEAAVQYGLLTKATYEATAFAQELAKLSGQALYEVFGRHILLELGGLRVVDGVQQMHIDRLSGLSDVDVTGDSLARYLTAQGFRVTEHNTAVNSIRMWLAKAGVFGDEGGHRWQVDQEAKTRLLGLPDEATAILAGFTPEQLAFTDALCQINPSNWYPAADVRDLAESIYGVRLGRSSLPKDVLEPLSRSGLIEYRTKGTTGGKTSELKVADVFNAEVLEPFVRRTVRTLDPALTAYYKTRPEDIYAGLESQDKYVKGQALEAYAIHIMRLLGLRFVAWRKRATDTTGRAEIDVLFTGLLGAIPTLWQVQCKNTPSGKVDLEDVAKEVGLVPVTQATHVLVIANTQFTDDATRFAFRVMRSSPLTIFLLDKSDFDQIKQSPGSLGRILRVKAEEVLSGRTQASTWSSTVSVGSLPQPGPPTDPDDEEQEDDK